MLDRHTHQLKFKPVVFLCRPQLKPGQPVPSPSELLGKILIKNKKGSHEKTSPMKKSATVASDRSPAAPSQDDANPATQGEPPQTKARTRPATACLTDVTFAPSDGDAAVEDNEEQEDTEEQDEEKMKTSDEVETAGEIHCSATSVFTRPVTSCQSLSGHSWTGSHCIRGHVIPGQLHPAQQIHLVSQRC